MEDTALILSIVLSVINIARKPGGSAPVSLLRDLIDRGLLVRRICQLQRNKPFNERSDPGKPSKFRLTGSPEIRFEY